jgi:hypothetical protein
MTDGSTGNILKHLQDDYFVDSTVIIGPDFKQHKDPMDYMVIREVKCTAEPWSKKEFTSSFLSLASHHSA